MWGTTGCDIMVIGRAIVRKIVGTIGRVGDGNGVDGGDGSDSNGVILEVAHVVSVVLYKRDGIGSDEFDPSKIERVFQIPLLRSQRRLE